MDGDGENGKSKNIDGGNLNEARKEAKAGRFVSEWVSEWMNESMMMMMKTNGWREINLGIL